MAKPLLGHSQFLIVLTVRRSRLNASRAVAFGAAVCFIAIWAMTGPLFVFGDIWQFTLVAVTSMVTFLMVFLIQNTQSRTRVVR